MKTYRLKIPRNALQDVLKQNLLPSYNNEGDYILVSFRSDNDEFIIYDNTKEAPYKAIYHALVLPSFLHPFLVETSVEKTEKVQKITVLPQIGSDEVGFGDFFGPLVVVSAYISEDNYKRVTNLGVTDSKKLKDEQIIMIASELIKFIPHKKNIVNNDKYNSLISEGYNMNKMKAMLHHNVLNLLAVSVDYHGPLYLDAFTNNDKFSEYTSKMKKSNIIQVKSGEENAISIATASVLARYFFLLEITKLNNLYQTIIPLGAGPKVDEFAQNFLKEKGTTALKNITKHNFRNFKDLFSV